MFEAILEQMNQALNCMRNELTHTVITPLALADHLDGLEELIDEMREALEPLIDELE